MRRMGDRARRAPSQCASACGGPGYAKSNTRRRNARARHGDATWAHSDTASAHRDSASEYDAIQRAGGSVPDSGERSSGLAV
jgi:hypothetical protein